MRGTTRGAKSRAGASLRVEIDARLSSCAAQITTSDSQLSTFEAPAVAIAARGTWIDAPGKGETPEAPIHSSREAPSAALGGAIDALGGAIDALGKARDARRAPSTPSRRAERRSR